MHLCCRCVLCQAHGHNGEDIIREYIFMLSTTVLTPTALTEVGLDRRPSSVDQLIPLVHVQHEGAALDMWQQVIAGRLH